MEGAELGSFYGSGRGTPPSRRVNRDQATFTRITERGTLVVRRWPAPTATDRSCYWRGITRDVRVTLALSECSSNVSAPGLAAWIVRARRVNGIACSVENTRQAGTTRANGADFLGRAVRDLAVEYQRLLEPSEFELAPAARYFSLESFSGGWTWLTGRNGRERERYRAHRSCRRGEVSHPHFRICN